MKTFILSLVLTICFCSCANDITRTECELINNTLHSLGNSLCLFLYASKTVNNCEYQEAQKVSNEILLKHVTTTRLLLSNFLLDHSVDDLTPKTYYSILDHITKLDSIRSHLFSLIDG